MHCFIPFQLAFAVSRSISPRRYFLDSTPSWSTRFAIRRRLLPLVQEIYGDGAPRNLASLAHNSDALHDEMGRCIVAPFLLSNTMRGALGVAVRGACSTRGQLNRLSDEETNERSAYWWRMVLTPLLHSIGNPMLSEKSLKGLLCRLLGEQPSQQERSDGDRQLQRRQRSEAGKGLVKEGWLELRKEWEAYLQQGALFFFRTAISNVTYSNMHSGDISTGRFELPMPPLDAVVSKKWAVGRGRRVAGRAVRWGNWRVRCVAVPAVDCTTLESKGLVKMEYAGSEKWMAASTYNNQASLLPLIRYPGLAAPLFGEARGGTINVGRRHVAAGHATVPTSAPHVPEPDFFRLLGGGFSYTLLVPLPTRNGDPDASWDHGLSLQPEAKLLPLKQLDRKLRRLVPVVAPSRLHSAPAVLDSQEHSHCLVDVEYEWNSLK